MRITAFSLKVIENLLVVVVYEFIGGSGSGGGGDWFM